MHTGSHAAGRKKDAYRRSLVCGLVAWGSCVTVCFPKDRQEHIVKQATIQPFIRSCIHVLGIHRYHVNMYSHMMSVCVCAR